MSDFNKHDPVHIVGAILAVVILRGFVMYGMAQCAYVP